jgi:hypothetical protein
MARCTHCYNEVMLKKDGSCPACGKHPKKEAAVAPDKTITVIGIHQPLPSCCLLCGSATEQRRRMVFWYDIVESKTLLAKILSRVPGNERRKALKVTLPFCEACNEASNSVTPHSVRLGLDYTLVTHLNFRKTFEALNGPPQQDPT